MHVNKCQSDTAQIYDISNRLKQYSQLMHINFHLQRMMHFQWMQIYATNPLDFDKQILNINISLCLFPKSHLSSKFKLHAFSEVSIPEKKEEKKKFKAATSFDCILFYPRTKKIARKKICMHTYQFNAHRAFACWPQFVHKFVKKKNNNNV